MRAYIFILTTLLFVGIGCRKKGETLVLIQVKDNQGQLVSGSTVELFTTGPYEQGAIPVLYKSTMTGSDGRAWFNFDDVYQLGQAGVAILDVRASKGDLSSESIIKVEEETTSKLCLLYTSPSPRD